MKQRLRIRFTKAGDLVWISHHDLMRLWERLLRRSGLPIAFSEGFNPRPKMSMPLALGIGIRSRDEVIEVELSRWTTAQAVAEALRPSLPSGMEILGLELLPPHEKGQVARVEYEVALSAEEAERLKSILAEVMARERLEIVRHRNQKPIDLKRYLLAARLEGESLVFSFTVTSQGTARPEEFCALLGLHFGSVPVRITKRLTEIPAAPKGLGPTASFRARPAHPRHPVRRAR